MNLIKEDSNDLDDRNDLDRNKENLLNVENKENLFKNDKNLSKDENNEITINNQNVLLNNDLKNKNQGNESNRSNDKELSINKSNDDDLEILNLDHHNENFKSDQTNQKEQAHQENENFSNNLDQLNLDNLNGKINSSKLLINETNDILNKNDKELNNKEKLNLNEQIEQNKNNNYIINRLDKKEIEYNNRLDKINSHKIDLNNLTENLNSNDDSKLEVSNNQLNKSKNNNNDNNNDNIELDNKTKSTNLSIETIKDVNNSKDLKIVNSKEEEKKEEHYYNYEQPIVNKINSTVAVTELFNSAESYLLHKKYNRTNNDQNDEDFEKLDNQSKDVLNLNKFNLINDLNLIKTDLNENNNQKCNENQLDLLNLSSYQLKLQSIGNLNLVSAISNFKNSNLNKSSFINNNQNSEVIINYCEKINPIIIKNRNKKSRNLLNNSYNDIPFNSFENLINEESKELIDIVKKVNLPISLATKPEQIELIVDEDDEELKDKKEIIETISNEQKTINNKDNEINIEKDHDITTISKENNNKNTNLNIQLTVIEEKDKLKEGENNLKMSTIVSPSNKIDLFNDLEIPSTPSSKMDSTSSSTTNKPLKGLLKKTKSSDSNSNSSNNSKKKRRVKFAETMMVFCDDWPEELMPQIIPITFKSSNEFNLVELAAQSYMNSYMFEPPAEYKDHFLPPPDYRDCINSAAACANSFVNQDLNFSNLPNHALLHMYENCELNENNLNENLLSKLDFDEDMFMKFSYGNAASVGEQDYCDLIKDSNQLEDNDEIDTYKNMILNNSNELLEEDDIIGVLKEDDILQAIGSQIDSLGKKDINNENNDDETICDSDTNELNDLNNQEIIDCLDNNNGDKDANNCAPGSIIIVNKNGNCQPIQIITSNENSDLQYPNIDDYPISPNVSLQDLASDSSITSQDTIIMMTNQILTNEKTNQHNNLSIDNHNELQMKRLRLKAGEFENTREDSSSKDSGITMDSSDNQDSLKDNLKDENNSQLNNNKQDENNNQEQISNISSSSLNQEENKLIIGVNGLPQFQKYSQAKSISQQDAQLVNNSNIKIEKSTSISVSELRESFERRMSLNSDKSDNSSSSLQTSSTQSSSSSSNSQLKDNNQENIYQNIPLNNSNYEKEIPFTEKWPNKNLIEYTAEPKVLMPNKRTTSLPQQQNYSPNNSNNKIQNKPSSSNQTTTVTTNQQNTQPQQQQQHLQTQIINQPQPSSPQVHKLNTNEKSQQQLFNNSQQQAIQNTIQQQALINQQLNQLNQQQPKLNLMQSIPIQRMPNGNIYLSIDRRALPHQIKMIPTSATQIRPPPYELSKSNVTNSANLLLQQHQQSQLKQTATILPHFHLIADKNQQQNVNNQAGNAQNSTKTNINNQSNDKQPPTQQQMPQQLNYQTLPIRFTTTNLASNVTNDPSSKCTNPNGLTANANIQQQGKPQLILIHSYPNNGNLVGGQKTGTAIGNISQLASLGNQKAIAIKIHHPVQPGSKTTQTMTETPALLTANGKIITAIQPNGTLLNQSGANFPNLVNSNALLQQALLRGALKDHSTSNFPNPSEIRRRDGINALPQVKDELESFVQQDIQRTERIKKKYPTSEEDDPSFGFNRRPSVKGIKTSTTPAGSKFSNSTSDLLKQSQISNQNKSNIIQLTTNKTSTLQRPTNSQIILTSQLNADKLKQATVNGQPIKITATQGLPTNIQKITQQNNQRHVYLIQQNSIANNYQQQQQRLVSAGATLPRNSNISLAVNNLNNQQPAHIQLSSSPQSGSLINKAFLNQQQSNNLQTQSANLNQTHLTELKSPASSSNTAVHLLTAQQNSGQQRPSSSLGDNKDNQLKTSQTANLNNIGSVNLDQANKTQQQQILYYHNLVNCNNKIALAPSNQSINIGQESTLNLQPQQNSLQNTLQYKTISMPNVALIKGQQLINVALVAPNQHQQPNTQQIPRSPNKDTASNTSTINSILHHQQQQQQQQQQNQQPNKSSANSKSSSNIQSSIIQCNNQLPNQTNNSSLVKDGTHLIKTDDKNSKSKQVNNNKEDLIFYSMNV